MNPETQAIIGVVTAIATFLAAIFAAVSAWTSKKTSNAAQASVNEAREARKLQLLPRLTLEKMFLNLVFFWPHPDTLNGEAVFLLRRHWKDNDPAQPTFTLKKFGESPALDVTLEFTLADGAGELILPEYAKKAGFDWTRFRQPRLASRPFHRLLTCAQMVVAQAYRCTVRSPLTYQVARQGRNVSLSFLKRCVTGSFFEAFSLAAVGSPAETTKISYSPC